jgi:uncharacterized membrane-anchored protein YhcB (DUF1043 family)
MSTLAAVLFGLIMFAVGGAIGYYFSRLDQSARRARQDEVQQEFDAYRTKVAEHFGKTADQFHAIGIQYRELYEHLAEGSAALCELDRPAGTAPFPPAIAAEEAAESAEAHAPSTEAAAAAGMDEARREEPEERPETVADTKIKAAAGPTPAADDGEADTVDETAAADIELDAEAGSDEEAREEVVVSKDVVEDDEAPAMTGDDGEAPEQAAQVADAELADDTGSTPDNVVELVPRTEADVEADKKSYS